MKKFTFDELKEILEKNNLRPSIIRLKVLDYLKNSADHPTVEDIFKKYKNEIPTLSRASIYNTLKILVEKNIAKEIMIEEDVVRYDGNTDKHGHFKCIKCGKVYDIMIKNNITYSNEIKDSIILEEHIYLIGICKNCKKGGMIKNEQENN